MRKILYVLFLFLLVGCRMSAVEDSVLESTPLPSSVPVQFTLTPSPLKACAVVVAVESVNVRDNARNVIGQLHYGDIVDVLDDRGDWWRVDGLVSGLVRSRYLQTVDCP